MGSTYALNLDLIAREQHTLGNSPHPRKHARNAPVLLNIRPNFYRTPKILSKLMHIRLAETKLNFKNSPPPAKRSSGRSNKSKAPRARRAIAIPQLPLVPFIIPLIPRLLPLLPSGFGPTLKQRFPHLKADSYGNLNIIKRKELSLKDKKRVYDVMKQMKRKGALTYPDFYNFRKLLL